MNNISFIKFKFIGMFIFFLTASFLFLIKKETDVCCHVEIY